jgi:hypothetical protein
VSDPEKEAWRARKEEAQRYLDQLRAQHQATLGPLARLDEAAVKALDDRYMCETLTLQQRQDPQMRAALERATARTMQNPDGALSENLAEKQDNIERPRPPGSRAWTSCPGARSSGTCGPGSSTP